MVWVWRTVLVIGGLLAGACASAPAGFDSPEPAQRLNAVAHAAHDQDQAAVPDLVRLLSSDDPAVRMFSIRTLERLTGQTLGYDHAAPEAERQEAIDRWVQYVEGEPATPDIASRAPNEDPS